MCDKVVSEDRFIPNYCHDKHKTQEKCDTAVDFYLLALKFVPDWFFRSKIIEKLIVGYFLMII